MDCAARVPRRMTWRIPALLAIRSSKTRRFCCFFLRRVTSPDSTPSFSALRIETLMRSGLAGLTRKSLAPARMASTAESMPPLAVSTITGRSRLAARSLVRTWRPSMSGIIRSSSISAICSPLGENSRSSAGPPPGAVTVVRPSREIAASRRRRCTGSSSTIRIVWIMHRSRVEGSASGKSAWAAKKIDRSRILVSGPEKRR